MLYTKIALGFLLALTLQGEAHVNKPGECFCGIPNRKSQNRVVGGQDADIGEYPWQAFLRVTTNNSQEHECGGTIVGKRHIITAAQCVIGDVDEVLLMLGSTNIGSSFPLRLTLRPKDIRIHPDYHRDGHSLPINDIAVIVLDISIPLKTYPHIKPACLPKTGVTSEDFVGKTGTVTGWGCAELCEDGTWPLQENDLSVLGNCTIWETEKPETRFCADFTNGHICTDDTGGPFVVNDPKNNNAMTLIGVVSYGNNGGNLEKTPAFADVPYFMQKDKSGWLMAQLQDLETCEPPQAA